MDKKLHPIQEGLGQDYRKLAMMNIVNLGIVKIYWGGQRQ